MKISTIPSDFIINATFDSNGMMQSDFLLRALRIENDSDAEMKIEKIAFQLKAQGRMVREVCYYKEALDILLNGFPDKAKNLGKIYLGTDTFWDCSCLSNSPVLQPGQETGIFTEFFLVVNIQPIDELVIEVSYFQYNDMLVNKMTLPVIQYSNRNKYIFPAKGCWQVSGNYDCICAHRGHYSMEFAFDIAKLNEDSLIDYKENMKNEDYVSYGKEIIAISDGEVTDCFNDFTRNIRDRKSVV